VTVKKKGRFSGKNKDRKEAALGGACLYSQLVRQREEDHGLRLAWEKLA
jgi:hypothetical protein